MGLTKSLIQVAKRSKPLENTIQHVFKENPELSRIGSQEAYKRYYQTIYPQSVIQIPFAHGTNSDLSAGLMNSVKVINTGAPETLGRNDMYFNLQPEASLQYVNDIGFADGNWNKKVYWPLKEVLGKPYTNNDYRIQPILPETLREQIPNRKGQFTRDIGGENGKWLSEYKAELGDADMSNEEFLERLGVMPGETFEQFLTRKNKEFEDIYDSGDYHGLYHVKADVRSPLIINGGSTYYGERGVFDQAKESDAILHLNADNEFGSDVLVLPNVNPEKVHIFGSKPDLDLFYNFMRTHKQGGILRAQKGLAKLGKNALETLAKEIAYGDMIKAGVPIYEAKSIFSEPYPNHESGVESIPWNTYRAKTTRGVLQGSDLMVGHPTAFDAGMSYNRALVGESLRTQARMQALDRQIAALQDDINGLQDYFKYLDNKKSVKQPKMDWLWYDPEEAAAKLTRLENDYKYYTGWRKSLEETQ